MGNGHDTLFLAKNLFPSSSQLVALDIDMRAIEITKERLINHGFSHEMAYGQISLEHRSHTEIDLMSLMHPCMLIIYNLGYLPGGRNKERTTQTETTLISVRKATELLAPGGVLSITAYPGHSEGEKEHHSLESILSQDFTPQNGWNITAHSWINRIKAPVLFLLQRAL